MKILVFSAHAADYCSRAGGTIAKHVRMGDEVYVVCLSYGERSEADGLYVDGSTLSIDDIRAIRREEATLAASILGARIGFLDWSDLNFDFSSREAYALAQEIRSFRPDVILTHHGPDALSMDHETSWQLVRRAIPIAKAIGTELEPAPGPEPLLFLFEATVPMTELEGFNPDVYVDVTDVWEIKLEALKAFRRSQGFLGSSYSDVARRRASQARRAAGYSLSKASYSTIEFAEAYERTLPWVGPCLPQNGL